MRSSSRAPREAVIHAMAMVGLVWALAVLGALFMAMSAQGQHLDGGYSLSAADSHPHQGSSVTLRDAPSTAGLVLTLLVLGGGATVLLVGATLPGRDDRPAAALEDAEPEPAADLPLALGLRLLA